MQETAWMVSLVLMLLITFGVIFVAINSDKRQEDYGPLVKSAYGFRTKLFWAVALVFLPAMIFNLMDLPYDVSRAAGKGAPQVINVTGHMWYWEMDRDEVSVGQPVEIHITSADVNHGFGIYDPSLRLVAQAQAMPGYTNVIRHTFDKEGTYRVLCMEYCGVAHHNMMTEIKVGKS
ncbi:cytochrome C oxidase subunit II [Nitrosospira briensis]|uniref:Cytochrome c oxidase subunit 2 n=1 Tax=Nitrosospira briensis TaxID=35799 RepID=A0A1I5ES21_9PROT|nr:cytochrome C oxidase subunit II [Nitrosospira briensis]SFO14315.1 cytochrome c oxidase subunit 2 [Nitrosospira briensis]SFO35204.1 cytochrome c oxidase subunit 2 [Nitrosospira briensis]